MSRPLPILFIHGFNGDPGDWTDGGFRQYLLEHGGLDPDLVRLFRYGVAEDGTYNNRGDLRQIASRLAGVGLSDKDRLTCSVDQLSADSVARGGPAQVTLIAHSLGGIISRYYLSRTTPDEFGTIYRGNVGRLITIASPHRGVDLLRLTELAPRGSLGWRFIRLLEKLGLAPALPAAVGRGVGSDAEPGPVDGTGASGAGDAARFAASCSPTRRSISSWHPDSPLLAELNRPGTMPARRGVPLLLRRHPRACGRPRRRPVAAGSHDQLRRSGRARVQRPGNPQRAVHAPPIRHPEIAGVDVARRTHEDEERSLADYLPETQHGKLLSNPAVQEGVLSVLSG